MSGNSYEASAVEEPAVVLAPTAEAPKPSFWDALRFLKITPHLAYEAIMHSAYLRNAAHGWDLRTHLTVALVRKYMQSDGYTIEEIQETSKKGLPFESESIEILPFVIPRPDEHDTKFLSHIIKTATDKLTEDANLSKPTIPDPVVTEVAAEWVIPVRTDKAARFECAEGDTVIIYAHGGAHYMGSASAHRFLTGQLSESVNAKVLSVDYRLSPQNPLPCALTDMLVSYLYVVETQHVPPSRIFFAGDSSGGCLILSMLEVILYGDDPMHRLSVPAGVVAISPWVDQSRCLPSESSEDIAQFDYIPAANFYPNTKPSAAWPAKNRRYWHYAENDAIIHPLASPITTPSWKGSCPLCIIMSEERLSDSGLLFNEFYKEAGNVTYLYYHERLPHVFHMLGKSQPSVACSFEEIANFVKDCILAATPSDGGQSPMPLEGKSVTVNIRGEQRPLERKIPEFTYTELRERIDARMLEIKHILEDTFADLK